MHEKIKVLHLIDKFGVKGSTTGGPSRLFSWWMPLFNKDLFTVWLGGVKKPPEAAKHLEDLGIPIHSIGNNTFSLKTLKGVYELVEQFRPDILHLHGYGCHNFGRMAGRKYKIPVIVHEHSTPKLPLYQKFADWLLRNHTTYAIAAGESVKKFLTQERFFQNEKVIVIHSGIPLKGFIPQPPEIQSKLKKELNIPANSRIVGIIARLAQIKGHRYLIESAPAILKEFPDTYFLIVGDGEPRQELEEMCRALNVSRNFVFTGHRDDIAQLLSITDVKVISSLYEASPLMAIEAMAMKKPIVATAVGGLLEMFEDTKDALLVAPRDSSSLSEKVIYLFRNPDIARKMGENAYVKSRQYDVTTQVHAMEELYLKIMGTGHTVQGTG